MMDHGLRKKKLFLVAQDNRGENVKVTSLRSFIIDHRKIMVSCKTRDLQKERRTFRHREYFALSQNLLENITKTYRKSGDILDKKKLF